MNFWLPILSGLSLIPAAVISFVRRNRVEAGFLPFFLLLWTSLAHEAYSYWQVFLNYTHALATNLYVLAGALLLLWQFCNWQVFVRRKLLLRLLAALLILLWLADMFFFSTPSAFNSLFILTSSLLIVLLALYTLIELVFRLQEPLLRNATFLICTALAIFHTVSALVEIFWLYGLNRSQAFQELIYGLLNWANLLSNLLFALAVLWIPRKRKFMLRFS